MRQTQTGEVSYDDAWGGEMGALPLSESTTLSSVAMLNDLRLRDRSLN